MSRILVVGSANADMVFRCPRFPRPGETVIGTDYQVHPGGKGANQAVAAARLGASVAFCGCVGGEAHGELLRASLEAAGVDTTHLRAVDAPTGTAGIIVDESGANMIVVHPGANAQLTSDDVALAMRHVQPSVVLAQLEVPLEAVQAAAEHPFFILDPAPAQELPAELLARCQIITPNETELFALSQAPGREAAVHELLARGATNVIVTLGEEGCLWATASEIKHLASPRVKAVDTTAAGDAFAGALAHFLVSGQEMEQAIRQAMRVAAISVTRHGAQESMPTAEELSGQAQP
jgi:ribokinase